MATSRSGPGQPRPPAILGGPAAWRGAALARSAVWLRSWSPAELRELEAAADAARGVPIERLTAVDFALPTLAPVFAALREELLRGRGFVVLRGLPVERYGSELCARILCGIGAHFGRALPQNRAGDLLGHVIDTGRDAVDPDVRIYQTRERQGFHTDSADLVALLCLQTARRGGRSSLVSCVTVHDVMRERQPELLEVLFEDFCTDHRGEFRPGARPYFTAPVLSWFRGELSVLYQRRYIESAQRFADVPRLSELQRQALDAFDAWLDDADLHLQMDLQPGDLQLVHNHQMLHDRTAFEDGDAPAQRRHLLRLWLCPPAGRPLPAWFAERLGSVEPGARGGVVLPGVTPVVRWSP